MATVSASGLVTAVAAGSRDHRRDSGRGRSGDFRAHRVAVRGGVGERDRARLEPHVGDQRSQATVVARDAANNILLARRADGRLDQQRDRRGNGLGVWARSAPVGAGRSTIGVTVDGVGPATFTLTVAPAVGGVGERERARFEPTRRHRAGDGRRA